MAIDIFIWPLQVDGGGDVDNNHRVRQVALGDGYEQLATDGINTRRISCSLVWKGDPKTAKDIENFLHAHVVRAFVFTPPGGVQGLYRVKPGSTITSSFISTRVRGIKADLIQAFGIEGQ